MRRIAQTTSDRFAPQALKALYEAQLETASQPRQRGHEHSADEYRGDKHRSRRVFGAMLKACRGLPAGSLDAEAEEVWLWSDLHLGHANIIRYTNRPFANSGEMDCHLFNNWRNTVGEGDTLVCVGDMAMHDGVGEHTWERIRSSAGARKYLVIGNHDLTGCGALRVDGFDDVCAVLCIDGDPPLWCTHMPLEEVPEGCVNVHGHTHDEAPRRSRHINVSVEQLDYRPVALAPIRALARELVAGRFADGATTLERLRSCTEDGASPSQLGRR